MKITHSLYSLCQLFAHAQMIRVEGDRELRKKGPRTRMSDPTLATENEIDREDSNTERVRLKRARGRSDERISS